MQMWRLDSLSQFVNILNNRFVIPQMTVETRVGMAKITEGTVGHEEVGVGSILTAEVPCQA